MSKSNIELFGWEIKRVRPGWFQLWLRDGIFPHAGGSLEYVGNALRKRIGA